LLDFGFLGLLFLLRVIASSSLAYPLKCIKTFVITMSFYYLFIEFLIIFLRYFKGFNKEEEAFIAYILIKVCINLRFSAMLLVRVLSKGK
jgi:hypothetical protein